MLLAFERKEGVALIDMSHYRFTNHLPRLAPYDMALADDTPLLLDTYCHHLAAAGVDSS